MRGWLGIVIQDVTDELSPTFGVREHEGVLVADVMPGSPAEAGGVRAGDVVVQFNGARVHDVPELQRRVAGVSPGQHVRIGVVRNGKPSAVRVTIGEMPSEEPDVVSARPDPAAGGYGMQVETVTPEAAERLDLPEVRGVLVTDVAAGGAADRAGLRRGDVILEIDRKPVHDLKSLVAALRGVPADGSRLLYVRRAGPGVGHRYVVLERGARP